jgi:hypothetical protein
MKLYTEEQVKHAIQMARASQNLFTTPFIYDKHEILEQLTPIELPSDEEIYEQGKTQSTFAPSFIYGAEWMRDKILK